MPLSHTISKNDRYTPKTQQSLSEKTERIQSENETWDKFKVPQLKLLALRVIAKNWEKNPIWEEIPTCENKSVLIELLPTNLPLTLTIKKIYNDYYWERAAKDRWKFNNPSEHGNSWCQHYCQRHLAEYLESLNPKYFEAQQEACEETLELLCDFISILRIRTLIPTRTSFKWSGDESEDPCTTEESPVHHIPMNLILPRLKKLTELKITFGVIYMNDGFEWTDFQFSVEDCLNLGRGIKDCPKLRKLVLRRNNLDQPRVAALLQGVALNNCVEEMDFSHCKLGDKGAQAIGYFLTVHEGLKVLNLANNKIGPDGIAGIVHGLLQDHSAPLKHLNLRLNPLQDAGGVNICALLLHHTCLEVLNVSGCGLGPETGLGISDVIASGHMHIASGSSLELDVSNNNFGATIGEAFEKSVKNSSVNVEIDSRFCNFTSESQSFIENSVLRYRVEKKRNEAKMLLSRIERMITSMEYSSMMEPKSLSSLDKKNEENSSSPYGRGDAVDMSSTETTFEISDEQSTIPSESQEGMSIRSHQSEN